MKHQNTARSLASLLHLKYPPVALARVATLPEGIACFEGEVPSSCSFWKKAETEVFGTLAKDHMNCPIGGMVMGFTLSPDAQAELHKGITMMCEVNYLDPKEAGHIPSLPASDSAVIYGPLAKIPVDPYLVLLWVTPAQAMILREASGDSHWTGDLPGGVFGRPACTALAVAAKGRSAALSFGCTGMRAFTETEESLMLAVISGEMLPDIEKNLRRVQEANAAMKKFYEGRKSAFSLQPKLPS